MSTPMLDLMPVSIRRRAHAGARTRRFVAACCATALCAGGAATWASLRLDRIDAHLVRAQTAAARALELEDQAVNCAATAAAIESAVAEYHEASFPVNVSALVAALAATLPTGATLESLTLDLAEHAAAAQAGGDTRMLRGGLAGFAASDEDVAMLARRLENRAPFTNVRLEYSRGRVVHEQQARGFAVSFEVDLQQTYVVVAPQEASRGAFANVQQDMGVPQP